MLTLLQISTPRSRAQISLLIGKNRLRFVTQNSISVSHNLALGISSVQDTVEEYNRGELQQENP